MAELLLELYSEEIPPKLQIDARNQLKSSIENSFKDKGQSWLRMFPTKENQFNNRWWENNCACWLHGCW